MANLTPIFGMVAAGAVVFGGYKVLSGDDVVPMDAQISVQNETEIDTTPALEQLASPNAQPILVSAEPKALAMSGEVLIEASAEADTSRKIGFPPLFVMGLMINYVTEKFADITGEAA